jgi:hypothetical protein
VREKFLGRSGRKRNWGRNIRIDSWERLEVVIELIKCSLPIDIRIELNHAEVLRPVTPPLPYDPRAGSSKTIPTSLPLLAEVRVSLCSDETLAWLLPVQFCIDQLLTAEHVVTKVADAFWFLEAWSQIHSDEGREHILKQRRQPRRLLKPPASPVVH